MLNYETLLSNYDDKLTLMQWLKKVEDALKDASAVSFDVANLGNATFKFKIVFEDGSEIESDPLVINQGDSVASAAIVNGDLILTLTNGDTIDAGSMFDGNVNITGTLDVGNDVNINGDVAVTGDVSVTGEVSSATASVSGVASVGSLSAGSATISGNASVGGNLPVVGTISGGGVQTDGYVEPSTASRRFDGNFSVALSGTAPTEQGFSIGYTHARVSNGKLSNVVVVKLTATSTAQSNYFYIGNVSVTLPTAIANSLVVAEGNTITTKSIPMYYFVSGDATLVGTLYFRADKYDNVLLYNIYYRSSTQLGEGKTIAVRLEDNYIL